MTRFKFVLSGIHTRDPGDHTAVRPVLRFEQGIFRLEGDHTCHRGKGQSDDDPIHFCSFGDQYIFKAVSGIKPKVISKPHLPAQ